nr:MAG TPA: hypothetical protein [Caudoviricetes sp.]
MRVVACGHDLPTKWASKTRHIFTSFRFQYITQRKVTQGQKEE